MAIEHKTLPIFGGTISPRKRCTDHGHQLLKNF